MMDMNKRRGRFSISRELFDDGQWDIILRILAGMIILRAECLWDRRVIVYRALNEKFDAVEPAEETPTYQIVITGTDVSYVRSVL